MATLRWTFLLALLLTADLARANHNVDCTVSGGTFVSNFECDLLPFTVEQGVVEPAQLSFDYNDSPTCLDVSLTTTEPWLSADPSLFSGTQAVSVTIDPSLLGIGTHTGMVVLTNTEAVCSSGEELIVNVTVVVKARGSCSVD